MAGAMTIEESVSSAMSQGHWHPESIQRYCREYTQGQIDRALNRMKCACKCQCVGFRWELTK